MTQPDFVHVLDRLSKIRPVFHSEADFQHALAWQIHEIMPHAQIRLEYRVPGLDRTYLDIWLTTADGPIAIELKYITRRLDVVVGAEAYELRNHGAKDIGRYDFVKDVVRIERVVEKVPGCSGAAIILTNEDNYWRESARTGQADAAFRIHDGRPLHGVLAWSSDAGPGTTKGRGDHHSLCGSYTLQWREYSVVSQGHGGRFRYLLLNVELAT